MTLSRKYWIAIFCKIIAIFSTLLVTIFINRGLGVRAKGEYSYIINMVEMLYIFSGLGLGQAYATFKRREGNESRNLFVFLSLFQGFLVLIIGIIFYSFFQVDFGIEIIVLTTLAVIRANFTMIAVIENSIKRNIIETVANIAYLLLLFSLYLTKMCNLKMVLLSYGLNEVFRSLVFIKIYGMKPKFEKVPLKRLRDIYSVGVLTMVVTLLISINYSMDTIMLKNMTNNYNVGIYSVAVTFSNMFLLIPDAFKEVLFGDSTNRDFSKKTALSAIRVSLLVSLIMLIGFIALGRIAIRILYGLDYIASFGVTLVIFSGSLSMIFFKILQPIYIAEGEQKKAVVFLAISAIINILFNGILIPQYGYYGAAIASAISYTVCGFTFFLDYLKNKNIKVESLWIKD